MKRFLAFALAAVAALVVAGAVAADNPNDKLSGNLFHGSDPFCDGSGFVTPGVISDGTYKFSFKSGNDSVSGKIKLVGAEPNTTYYIRLVQGIGDCFTDDAVVTTNGKGKAKVKISEEAVSGHAFLFACDDPAEECSGESDFYASEPIFFHGASDAAPTGKSPAAV